MYFFRFKKKLNQLKLNLFDDGKVYNKHFKELLEKNNIEWFSTYYD
jgi:hypothetical protein